MRHYCRQVLTSVGDAARRPFSRSGLSSRGTSAGGTAGGSKQATPRSAPFSRGRGNKVQPVAGPQGGAGGELGPAQLLVIDESHAFKDSPGDVPVRQAWGENGGGVAGAPAPGAAYAPRTQQTRTRPPKGPGVERSASRAAV